ALLKQQEVVQLRGTVERLRSQYEAEANTDRLKCDFHDATTSIHRLRTEILTVLGCDTVDDQCVKAITTNEAKYFWSFVDNVKSASKRAKKVSKTYTRVLLKDVSVNSAINCVIWHARSSDIPLRFTENVMQISAVAIYMLIELIYIETLS
ncbi:hypothetical protein F5051DRAFT_434489, partial [Lentinula edodes]